MGLFPNPAPTFRFYAGIIFRVSEKTTRGSSLRGDRGCARTNPRSASHFYGTWLYKRVARDTLDDRKAWLERSDAMKAVCRGASAAILLLLCGACAHTAPATEQALIREYLDPQTAMTVRVVAEPFIYGRDVPELAVNARDFVSLGAVELDNMGRHRLFLALVSWSTIDRARIGAPLPALPERLEIASREWPVASHTPRELGAGEPVLEPPVSRIGDSWFEVKAADLRDIAGHPPESIDVVVDGARHRYTLWRRADAAFAEFASTLPTDVAPARGRRRHIGP